MISRIGHPGLGALLLVAAAAASTLAQQAPTLWPTSKWTSASLASQGLLPDPILAFDSEIRAGAFGNIDHMLVVKHGRLVFNERYERDYREISRGRVGPIGCGEGCTDPDWMHEFNYYHPDWHPYLMGRDIHTLQSVTKSIAATVVGIALGRGRIGSLNRPVLDFFKYRSFENADPRLKQITVRDVLTMRSGIEWHEQNRPLDDTNTTVQLEKSLDWIDFTLSQPMNADPGTHWGYNSGGSMLLSGVIKTATSLFIDDYAKQQLFVPLGIKDFRWKATPTGHPDTEGGLYLSAPDLAKIGYLYLHDGVWNGRRILPAGWVSDATSRHAKTTNPVWDYGYQWWLTSLGDIDIWAAKGFGGQYLVIIPSRDLVGVIYAWNIFGERAQDSLAPFIDALLAAGSATSSGE